MFRGVKGFIFDLDGTLVDSVEAHVKSWIIALRSLGFNVDEELLRNLIGLSGKDILIRLYGSNILKHYKDIRRLKDRAFLQELREGRVQTFPGVMTLLRILKNLRLKIAVASSTPSYLLLHICEYLGIIEYADVIVGGDEVNRGKPHPDLFMKTIKLLGLNPKDVVIVGDTYYDIEPANVLGATSVLVNTVLRDHIKVRPKYYFRWIFEMIKWVKS